MAPQGCLCFVSVGCVEAIGLNILREGGGSREMGGIHTLKYPETNSMKKELKITSSAYCNTRKVIT